MKSIKLIMDHIENGIKIGSAGDVVEVSDETYDYLQNCYGNVRQEAAPQVEQVMQLTTLIRGKKK